MNIVELSRRVELDVPVYVEIARMFCDVTGHNLEDLQRAVEDGASQTVADIAHRISGSAGGLGMDGMHEAAREIERCGRENTLDGLQGKVAYLKNQLREISAALIKIRV
jgi:HPt (histidine-containing phosphotransfer) domain-containing protein